MGENNECMICGLENDENSFSLLCGTKTEKHTFHITCLNEALKTVPGSNYYNYNQKQCPYCRHKITGFIPCPEGTKPIKGLHKEYANKVTNTYKSKTVRCQGFYKSGANAGKQCNNYCSVSYSFNEIDEKAYCGLHAKQNKNINQGKNTIKKIVLVKTKKTIKLTEFLPKMNTVKQIQKEPLSP